MRVTKGHSNNRRAHHTLTESRLSICPNCNASHERHKVCLECGMYRGKQILEIKQKKSLVTKAEDEKTEDIDTEEDKDNKKNSVDKKTESKDSPKISEKENNLSK